MTNQCSAESLTLLKNAEIQTMFFATEAVLTKVESKSCCVMASAKALTILVMATALLWSHYDKLTAQVCYTQALPYQLLLV